MTPDNDGGGVRHDARDAGLCADCLHARRITSSRGSVFYMCEYWEIDPAYPRYPRLPVLQCAAFMPDATTT